MESTKDGEIADDRKDEGGAQERSSFRLADLPAFKKPKLHLQEGVPSDALNPDSSKKDILAACLAYVQKTADAQGDSMKPDAFLPSFLNFLADFELDYYKKQTEPMPTDLTCQIAEFLEGKSEKNDIIDTCLAYAQRIAAKDDPMKLEAFLPSFLTFLDDFELEYCKKQLGPMPTDIICKMSEFLKERSDKLDLLSLNKEIFAEGRRELVPWPSGLFDPVVALPRRFPTLTHLPKYRFSQSSPYMLAGEPYSDLRDFNSDHEAHDIVLRLYNARRGLVHMAVIQNAGCCSISPTCEQVAAATYSGSGWVRLYRINDLASEIISLDDYSETEIPGEAGTACFISDVEFSEAGNSLCVRTSCRELRDYIYIFDPSNMEHLQNVQFATFAVSICTSDCLLWQDRSTNHPKTFVQSIFDATNSEGPTDLHDVFGNIKIHGFAQHALSPSLVAFVGEEIVPPVNRLARGSRFHPTVFLGVAEVTMPDEHDEDKSISCKILATHFFLTSTYLDFSSLDWIPRGDHIVVRQVRDISLFTFDESSAIITKGPYPLALAFDQVNEMVQKDIHTGIDGFAADHNCNTLLFRYTIPNDGNEESSPLEREHLFTNLTM